ncbi:hypothetical protein KO02_13745 [Sphingobacterium sp. ML3W]|uniref:hypothetical protein n=1 Tax=Sphingobacterium sp. ML3W TaxID=1538644 RepID=UPI0004F5AAA2|nr:hypothetical protein [Sphingobacterium sp. ML3W]AIM37624.1 hypothetical protein KO02_13745 [Sphingobacterium sp. ML3W]
MNKSNFKKIILKKINKGDLFSFLMNDSFYYGRILNNNFLGLISIIYKTTTKHLKMDIDFFADSYYEPPMILDGYSLFQLKSEGDWGIISSNADYEIPEKLLNYIFTNVYENLNGPLHGMDINGNNLTCNPTDTNLKIADNAIYGDYDVAEYLKSI